MMRNSAQIDRDKISRILILSVAGVGDTLLFTPALKLLRNGFPNAHITMLVMYRASLELLQGSEYLDDIVWWPFLEKGYLRSLWFMLQLGRQGFDLCIKAFPAARWQYNLLSLLSRARYRICVIHNTGQDYKTGVLFHTHTILQKENSHHVVENLRLLELLGIDYTGEMVPLEIPLTEADREFTGDFLAQRDLSSHDLLIGLHPGTGETKNLHLRRWPKENFAQLGDELDAKYNARIILFGGPNERQLRQEIAALMSVEPVVADDLTMKQTAATIERCNLFISNDSSLMHVASATRVPVVAIFGPTNTNMTYPWGTEYEIVHLNFPCSPCYHASTAPLICYEKKDFECVKSITVAQVVGAVEKLMKRCGLETAGHHIEPS